MLRDIRKKEDDQRVLSTTQAHRYQHRKGTSTNAIQRHPLLGSARMTIAIVGFLGFVNLYAQRINLSVAMVCMVNHTEMAIQQTHKMANVSRFASYNSTRLKGEDQCEVDTALNSSRSTNLRNLDGEFAWSKEIQGHVLASFFYGYMVTQVPGGWLAHQFGGVRVYGWSMLVCALATLLMPVGARAHYGVLIFLRVVAGLMQAVTWPAMHCVWSHWAPPLERSILIGGTFAGAQIGNVLALSSSGLLCAYGFDGGWPTIFYVFGGLGVIWVVAWMYLVYDTPAQNPRISLEEKLYVQNALSGLVTVAQPQGIPWMAFATSVPVWAIVATHVLGLWGTYAFLTNIPTYMSEVLKFDIKANGLLSALPYIGFWIAINVSATLADILRSRKILSTTWTRKLFNSIGQLGPALFLVILANLNCNQTALAVFILVLGVSLSGCMYGSGFVVNHADIAPTYAGLLFGITNTFGTIPGFVAPIVIGKMTTHKLRSEWQAVFYLSAAIFTVGAVIYIIFGSGEVQPWAKQGLPEERSVLEDTMEYSLEELPSREGESA